MMPLDDYDLYFLVGSEFRLSIFGNEDNLIKYDAHDGLAEEIKNFDDLIVGEFEDNYENLPIKTFLGEEPYFSNIFYLHFLGYKFLSEVCNRKYEFVTFTDDDTFIDWSKFNEFMTLEDISQPATY